MSFFETFIIDYEEILLSEYCTQNTGEDDNQANYNLNFMSMDTCSE